MLRRRNLATVAAVGGAALGAAAEATARTLEPHLAERPLRWHDRVAQQKALDMAAARRGGGTGGCAIVGNSMALVGVRPEVWANAAGVDGPIYNAALHRGVPTVTERWVREEVAPVLRPRSVLYGVSVLDFNDNGEFHRKITSRYDNAPRTAMTGRRRFVAALLRRSATARIAPVLTRPAVVGGALLRAVGRRPPAASPVADLVDASGWGCEFSGSPSYRHTSDNHGWLTTSILVDYACGGPQTAAFRRTVGHLRATGVEVAATLLPVTDDFVAAMPGGAAGYSDAVGHIRTVCEDLEVPLDDVTEAFDDLRWFADSFHLHGDGARHFSDRSGAAHRRRTAAGRP